MLLTSTLIGACQPTAPSTGPSLSPPAVAEPPAAGRTRCAGSVPAVLDRVEGAAADELEALQAAHESERGFLAVVHDGRGAVIVVEGEALPAWQARLIGSGFRVAPSCIQPALLAAVHAALPHLKPPQAGFVSARYDALADALVVAGATREELVLAIERVAPGTGAIALAAIEAGTLRVTP